MIHTPLLFAVPTQDRHRSKCSKIAPDSRMPPNTSLSPQSRLVFCMRLRVKNDTPRPKHTHVRQHYKAVPVCCTQAEREKAGESTRGCIDLISTVTDFVNFSSPDQIFISPSSSKKYCDDTTYARRGSSHSPRDMTKYRAKKNSHATYK